MANDIRQPRASIACSRNRDPDYIALASTVEGLAAVAVFDALLCAAKDQGNRGTFTAPDSVVAMLCGVPESIFIQSKIKLIGLNWLSEIKPGVLNIRSFEKWNPVDMRGGARLGAGRPAIEDSKQSNDIQNETKPESKDIQNNQAPSPSPYPLESTTLSDKSDETVKNKRVAYSDDFETFWGFVPTDKKTSKGAAYRAWKKLGAEDRLKAIDRMEWTAGCFEALDPGRQRIKYLTDPQGWLNQRKFEDADEAVELIARGK